MKKIFSILFIFLSIFLYSQENSIIAVSNELLRAIGLSGVRYYNSLEAALELYQSPIEVKITKRPSENDSPLIDFYYTLIFPSYNLSLYKRALSDRYCLNSIQIIISENDFVKALLPYHTINDYKRDSSFGLMLACDHESIVYEIEENWEYLTLSFSEGKVHQLVIVFHTE
jgi:hypothetical protein